MISGKYKTNGINLKKAKVYEFLKIQRKKGTLVLLLLKARIKAILKEKKIAFLESKTFLFSV
jgi:hypothetical protein